MLSLRHQKVKIFGIVLCAVLVFSVYAGFAGFVSDLFRHNFIEAISLSSKVGSDGDYRFVMGDTLTVSARVKFCNVYRLSVQDNSSRPVFEEAGRVNEPDVKVSFLLYPPAFNSSQAYSVRFEADVSNFPLPGVNAYDSSPPQSFTLIKSLTSLNLTASYDEASHALQSVAFLTTSDGLPVANRTVSFCLQPNVDFVKPDRGWTYLESATTGPDGSALCSVGLNMMGGLHGLQARFAGDEGFGSSTATSRFNVGFRQTVLRIVDAEKTASSLSVVLQLTDQSGYPLGGKILSFLALSVTPRTLYAVTNETGYVVISAYGTVGAYVDSKIAVLGDDYVSAYETQVRLVQDGSHMSVAYSWDASGSGSFATGPGEPPAETASARLLRSRALASTSTPITMAVSPNASAWVDLPETIVGNLAINDVGNLTFYFSANNNPLYSVNASWYQFWEGETHYYGYLAQLIWYPDQYGNFTVDVLAVKNSDNTTVGEGTIDVVVGRAFSNLVVYYPGAFSGDSLSLMVAFSKTRTENESCGSSYFQTVNFAPSISWDNNTTYALDQPDNDSIRLLVNSSETDFNSNSNGVYTMQFPLNGSAFPCRLNVTAAVNETCRWQANSVSQVFNLTRISVSDDPTVTGNTSRFSMSYSMSVLSGTATTYVNASDTVQTSVTVQNRSACNVQTSFMTGCLGTRLATNASGFVNIGSNYTGMRVVSACSFGGASPIQNPWTDVNRDGIVNMADVGMVSHAFNAHFNDSNYNWTLDVDANGYINMGDIGAVARDFNYHAYYLPFSNGTYCPNFDCSGIRVDSNIGQIRLDSRGFAWNVSGVTWLNMSCKADVEFFSSVGNGSAVTDNSGQAKVTWNAPSSSVYVAEASLGSQLNLTVATDDTTSHMNASLCTSNYYYVFRRPVDVSLSWDSQLQQSALTAYNDSYVIYNNSTNWGTDNKITLNGPSTPEIGYIRFNLSSVPADACILSARLDLFRTSAVGNANCTVYRVTGNWTETSINWFNKPGNASVPSASCAVSGGSSGMWLSFNVTDDVRCWSNGSSPNCGFALFSDAGTIYLRSREYGTCPPSLEIAYLNGSQDVCVSAYDEALHRPATVNVTLTVNDVPNANGKINESTGVWDRGAWWPPTTGTWNLGATSADMSECVSASTLASFTLGSPTSMVSLDGNLTDASAGSVVSSFSLCLSSLFSFNGMTVNFFVNGTYGSGTPYNSSGSSTTLANGTVRFEWNAPDNGTFSVHATFGGDAFYLPCDAYELVTVNRLPLSTLFTVSPAEFKPGDRITLNATVIDPLTSQLFTNHNVTVQFFESISNGTKCAVGPPVNSTLGVSTLSLNYPNDSNAYAYNATILGCTDGLETVSNVVSNPVQLTVGSSATLDSIVSTASTKRTIDYWFEDPVFHRNLYLTGRQITVKINGTVHDGQCLTTDGYTGVAEFSGDFQAVNNSTTTYAITASFAGDNPVSASANSTALDGSCYATCTTVKYNYDATPCGYETSSNCIVITVTPQSTQAILSKGIGRNEGLQLWGPDSFCLWPPFFKLHAKVIVDSLGSNVQNWVGLFACGVDSYSGLLKPLQNAFQLTPIDIDVVTGAITAVITGISTLYWLNMIAASVAEFTLGGYLADLACYTVALIAPIWVAYSIPDATLSKAILYGICFTLVGLTMGAFWNDPQARLFPSILRLQLPGADPVTTAVKYVLNNCFLTTVITAANLLMASIVMINPLMWPFATITFAMALVALDLVNSR